MSKLTNNDTQLKLPFNKDGIPEIPAALLFKDIDFYSIKSVAVQATTNSTRNTDHGVVNVTDELLKPPIPPENCCLSGCQHCVWDVYADELKEYAERIRKLKDTQNVKKKDVVMPKDEDLIDPGIKAFLESEMSLKRKASASAVS